MKRICKDCGKEFTISDSEIDFFKKKNLDLPKRCSKCRNKNKLKSQQNNIPKNVNDNKNENKQNSSSNTIVSYENTNNTNNNKNNNKLRNTIIAGIILLASFFGFNINSYFDTLPSKGSNDAVVESSSNNEVAKDNSFNKKTDDKNAKNTPPIQNDKETTEKHLTFRNDKLLTDHFEKHKAEFNYNTKEEYVNGALLVINSPTSKHKIEAEDGDEIYYDEAKNEIVFVSKDGYIRTYFKPSNGINYFNKQ